LSGRWPLVWEAFWINVRCKNVEPTKRALITDLSRFNLINLYKSADLFVFASHVEYSPLVLFEAVASRTPFLASSAGNSQEIAAWTGGGRVVLPQRADSAELSIPELAQQMVEMTSDRSRMGQQGEIACKTIFQKGFTWADIVDKYEVLLTKPLTVTATNFLAGRVNGTSTEC
jgi:glycosyltransferase involved in cell wall biosynthesis